MVAVKEPEKGTVEAEQGGMGGLVILVLLALAFRGRGGDATGPAAPANGDAPLVGAKGEVMDLSVTATNQIVKLPGDVVGVIRVSFRYKGPQQSLIFGWGVKPRSGGLFTAINFANGDNLIDSPQRAWNWRIVAVKASTTFVGYNIAFPDPVAAFNMPDPRKAQSGRDGRSLGLGFGSLDVWTWLASGDAIFATTTPTELLTFPPSLTDERNLLIVASPGNVYDLIEPATTAAADQLNLAFV